MTQDTCSNRKWEEPDHLGRVLDARQFAELNAVFYSADPSEFIKMRAETLALHACRDDVLAPVYASDRRIGKSISVNATSVPHSQQRYKYIRMEAVTIVHHASEALLRLFFAHVDFPECPWLGMSTSTDFAKFKAQVRAALEEGFNQQDIAEVFLGGSDPEDAGIKMGKNKFKETITAIDLLLVDCANRFLEESFLYNAVKHGLTAIDTDAKMNWTFDGSEPIPILNGFVHGYLHKKLNPTAKNEDGQWFLSLADSNPERDLAVTTVITYALDSLWDVARRRYMGVQGKVYCLSKATVDIAIHGPIYQADSPMHRMTHELAKTKADGEIDGPSHHLSFYRIPEEFDLRESAKRSSFQKVDLPVRPQDIHVPSSSSGAYLPIVPRGYQQGN